MDLRDGILLGPTAVDDFPRGVLEAAPDALVVVDAHGRIVLLNRRAEAIFGYARDALVGRPIEQLVPVRMHAAHEALRDGYLDRPTFRPLGKGRSLAARRADGTELLVEVTLSPMSTPSGTFVVAAVRDATERERAARALAESEAAFRALFEHAPDGIFLGDLDGRCTDANAKGCALLGYLREELVGKRAAEFVPEEDAPRLRALREMLVAGPLTSLEGWTLRRKDGSFVPVEISVTLLADGRWQVFVRDVTERKRAEREREEGLQRLRAVLDQCPAAIVLARRPGQGDDELNRRTRELLACSPAHLSGVTLYKPNGELLPDDERPCVRALRAEHIEWAEYLVRRGTGELLPILASAAPVVNALGEVQEAVVVFQDITPLKQLERLRAEWNATVAHDLRQPLNAIMLRLQLMAADNEEASGLGEAVQRILRSAARLNRMVDDLLDLSQLDAGHLALRREPVNVTEVVREVASDLAPHAPNRSIAVHARGSVVAVDADPTRVAQIVNNLMGNAIKYGAPATPIAVEIEGRADEVAVAVTSHGRAIATEDLPRIFERYYRAPSARREGIVGSGLGLHITRGLVEAHGGRIHVTSTPEGTTTFSFTLPIRRPETYETA